jgi:LL-diaminopimelate aminotransferase
MAENFVQQAFAQRIGGAAFGKDTQIYKFEKIKRAKRAAMAAHPEVELIDMGVGEPDEMAFPQVVDKLCIEAAKWENRQYTDNGINEFREAVQRYMRSLYQVELNPATEIVHSIGSKSALALLPACFVNPGDLTIMTTPGYPVLGTWSKYLGGEVVNLPLTKANGFFPDLESLSAEQRRRAKLLYLNYPNNPTGASATAAQYQRAIDFCARHEILIVCDAAYAALNFSGKPLSILSLPGGRDVAVELHSLSKGFNMTGWRLGWVCGNPLAVNAFATVKDNADSGQFAAIQRAAVAALDDQAAITPRICEKYSRRLRVLVDTLRELGFDAQMPQGSFFLYVQIPKGTRSGVSFANAEQFSQWMITEKLISTVPWDDAGSFVRFSATFVAPTIEAEQRVLGEVARRLRQEQFVF